VIDVTVRAFCTKWIVGVRPWKPSTSTMSSMS
jgi:hypothetical protein